MSDATLWVIREPGNPTHACPWLRLCPPDAGNTKTMTLGETARSVPDRVVVFPSRESALDWCPPGWLLGNGTGGLAVNPIIEPAPADLRDRFPVVTLRDAHAILMAQTMPDYGRTVRAWALMPLGPYDQQCRCRACRAPGAVPRTFRYITHEHRAIVFPTEAMAHESFGVRGWLAGKPLKAVEWDGDDCGTGLRPIDGRAWAGGLMLTAAEAAEVKKSS